MSELLDERVVEMRFDNADFEQNVNQSIKTINKLKDSLDFDNAGESFENISAAAAKCDMKPLEDSIESISVKFNMLELVAANVLSNIVNKVADAAVNMTKSLTIDQVTAGWSKYEQKTQSVQTIMAATGESIDVVNNKLEKLIWFADETSYDFVDMVNNIGKFTSAGVDLDTAVNSMMGISNWAAISGAGIQQASRAMYNLSQAIGMGYVGIQDWKSIELANMATIEFKETVLETALAFGTLKQEADGTIKTLDGKDIVTAETMRNSLKKQWFTSDVLNAALDQYSEFANEVYAYQNDFEKKHGYAITVNNAMRLMEKDGYVMDSLGAKAFAKAQEAVTLTQAVNATADAVSSGWMRTFETIFGNYEKAKKLWTNLANDMWDIFAWPGETRNNTLYSVMESNYQKMLDEMPDGSDFNERLQVKITEIARSNGKTEKEIKELWRNFDSVEELLTRGDLSDFSLDQAFSELLEEYHREGDLAGKLSADLKSGDKSLKSIITALAYGYGPYSKDAEKARKEIEKIGLDYDWAMEMANAVLNGAQIDWNAITKDLVTELDSQKSICDEFVAYLSESLSWGYDGFFGRIKELGGRDKLMGALDNILKTFKNIYRLVLTTSNAISEKFGGNSLILSILDGFNKLTGVFAITDEKFEAMEQSINDFFFNGGFETKLVEFVEKLGKVKKSIVDFFLGKETLYKGNYYDKTLQRTVSIYEREGGLFQKIYNLYQTYIGRLPENVRDSIEKIRTSISGFLGDVPKKFEELKTKITEIWTKVFGEETGIGTYFNPITKKIGTYTKRAGGLIDEFKQKILSFGNGAVGKAIEWLAAGLKKIGDLLFGYKKDGEDVQGIITIIYDKMAAFWQMLKDIGKAVEDIFERFKSWLGLDFEKVGNSSFFDILLGKKVYKTNVYDEKLQRTVSVYERTGGILGKVKEAYSSFEKEILKIAESAAFIAIKNFIFGDEESKIPNIFGRIKEPLQDITEFFIGKKIHKGTTWSDELNSYIPLYERQGGLINKLKETIQDVTDSNAFKAIRNFIFGDEESKTPNIFGRIQSVIDSIAKSTAFIAIKNFIFGDEKANIPNIFGRIQSVIDSIAKSTAFIAIKNFIFGDEESKTPNIFGRIQSVIDSIAKSTAFIAIKNFIFGDEESKTPNIFGRIQSVIDSIAKSTAFIAIKNFIFGNEKANIPNIFGRIKETIQSITDSTAFKAVRNFIFGDEESKTPNIFGRIKEIIQSITDSTAFKTVRNFIFGDNEGNTNGSIGILERIQNFLQSIYESTPFKAIWRFFFGDEELNDGLKEGTETLDKTASKSKSTLHEASLGEKRDLYQIKDDSGRMIPFEEISSSNSKLTGFQKLLLGIKEKFEAITSSKAYNDIKEFFFGSKRAVYNEKFEIVGYVQDAPNIIQRITGAIEKLPESIRTAKDAILNFFLGPVNEEGKRTENIFKRLPTYISAAKDNIADFFIGKKIHKGTTWSDELNSYIPLYEREGGLINKLKETFEKLKSEHPWFASFCSFIETQIQNIRKIFSEAGGDISLAFENLNTYLNGGHFKHKNELGEIETDLEETDGVITNIRKNIEKLFNGGKEKSEKSVLERILEYLGIGRNRGFLTQLRDFIATLTGMNIFMMTANLKFGDFLGIQVQTGLEAFIDSLKALAISVAIIAATLAGMTIFINYLQTKGYATLAAAFGVITLIFALLVGVSYFMQKKQAELNAKTAVVLLVASGMISVISGLLIILTGLFFGIVAILAKFNLIENHKKELLVAGGVLAGLLTFITLITAFSVKVAKKDEKIKSSSGVWFGLAAVLFGLSHFITTIAILLGAFYLFPKNMDKLKEAGKILGGLIGLAVAMVAATAILARIATGGRGTDKTTFAIIVALLVSLNSFLISVSAIVAGIYFFMKDKTLSDLKTPALVLGGIILSVAALIGLVLLAVNKFSKIKLQESDDKKVATIDKSVFGLLIGIVILVERIKTLVALIAGIGAVTGWENIAVAFGGISILLLAIAGTAAILGSIKKVDGSVIKNLALVSSLIISIGVMVSAIVSLVDANPEVSNIHTYVLPIVLAIGEILLLITAVSGMLQFIKNAKLSEINNADTVFLMILGTLTVLTILIGAIYGIAKSRNLSDLHTTIFPIVAAIAAMEVLVAGIVLLLKFIANNKIDPNHVGTLDLAAISIVLILGLLVALAAGVSAFLDQAKANKKDFNGKWKELLPLFEVVGELIILMIPLSMMLSSLGKAKVNAETIVAFMAMTVVIGALIIGAKELINYADGYGDIKTAWKTLVPMLEVISEIIAITSLLVVPLALIKHFEIDIAAIGKFISMAVIVGILGAAAVLLIQNIEKFDVGDMETAWKTLLPLIEVISELIAVATLLLVPLGLLKLIKIDWKTVFQLGALILYLYALVGAVAILSTIAVEHPNIDKWDSLLPLLTGILGMVIAIGAMVAVLMAMNAAIQHWGDKVDFIKNFGKTFLTFLGALGSLMVLVIAMTALGAVLYAVQKGLSDALGNGWMLESIKLLSDMLRSMLDIFVTLGLVLLGIGLIYKVAPDLKKKDFGFKSVAKNIAVAMVAILEIIAGMVLLGALLRLAQKGLSDALGASDDWMFDSIDFIVEIMDRFSGALIKFSIAIALIQIVFGFLDGIMGKLKVTKTPSKGLNMASIIGGILKAVAIIGVIIAAAVTLGAAFMGVQWLGKKLFKNADDNWLFDAIDLIGNLIGAILGKLVDGIKNLVTKFKGNESEQSVSIGEKLSGFMKALGPFLEQIRSLSLSDINQVAILGMIMAGLFATELFQSAALWAASLQPDGDIATLVNGLSDLFGEDGAITGFLTAIQTISWHDVDQVNLLADIMKALFVSELFSSAAAWAQSLQTGGDISEVAKGLSSLLGENGSLTGFLNAVKDITLGQVAGAQALAAVMGGIFTATLLEKGAEWASTIKTGGNIDTVVKGLSGLLGEKGSLTGYINAVSNLDGNSVKGATYLSLIMGAVFTATLLKGVTEWASTIKTGGDFNTVVNGLSGLLGEGGTLTAFLEAVKNIGETEVKGAGNLSLVIGSIMADELMSKIAEYFSTFNTGGNFETVVAGLSNLLGTNGTLTQFLNNVSAIGDDKVKGAENLASVMNAIMLAEFLQQMATYASTFNTGGSFDQVATGLSSLLGENGKLTAFLDAVKDLDENDATRAGYLTDIMAAIFVSEVFDTLIGFASQFSSDGGQLATIATGLGQMVADLQPFLTAVQDLEKDDVTRAGYLPQILGAVVNTQLLTAAEKITSFISGSNDTNYVEMFGKLTKENGLVDGVIMLANDLREKKANLSGVSEAADAIGSVFELLHILSDMAEVKDSTTLIDRLKFWKDTVALDDAATAIQKIDEKIVTEIVKFQTDLQTSGIDAEYIKNTVGLYLDIINTVMNLANASESDIDFINFEQLGKNIIDGLILSFSNMDDRNRVYESALKLGQYIAEGLITGVNGSTDALDTAGTDMADTVTEATADELEVASPSRVMYEIGQFVVQGLINGIHAGSYEAKKEAERLSAVIEDGVSKHDINMAGVNIEMDWELAYGNLDNLKDSVGNIDFEKIREFLHGQYDELLGTEYIDAFINSWAGKWKQIPQILDETQSKIVKGIANNEYGYTQEEILTNLEKELGSAEDAQKAWQNYNDVLADNIKLNQENAKEQVASAQMTKEEYAEIERLFNEAHSGKYDAQNGDTRVDRLVKEAGATREQAELVQRMLNDQYEYGLSPSYVRAEKQLKELREEEEARRKTAAETSKAAETTAESMTDATDGIDAATESLDNLKTTEEAVAEAADDASKSIVKIKDSAKEVLKNVDKKTLQEGYAAWKAGRDMTAEQAEQFNYIRKQNRLQNLGSRGQRDAFYKELGFDPKDANDFFNNADPYQNARRRMEGNAESYSRVVEKETEAAKKAAEAKGSIKDTLDYIEENESSDLEKNKKMYQEAFKDTDDLLNAAFDRMRKGEKLTEDQVDFLYEFQKAIGTDIFGSGKDRRKEFKSLGISEENLDMAMRIYGWNLEKYNQTAKEASNSTTDLTKKITQNGTEAEMMSMVYEALPEEIKGYADGFSDIFTAAFDEKTGNIKITDDIYKKVFKVNDVNKLTGIGKTVYDTIGTGFEMGKGTLENLLKENGLELNGKSVSSFFSKETFAKMFQSDSGIFDLAGTIKENIDPLQMFGDFIGGLFSGKGVKGSASAALVNGLSSAFKLSQNVVENVEEISNTVLDPEADLTDLDYFNAYLEKIKENYALITDSEGKAFIAIKGYQNLIEGKDLTTSQAQELTKLYDAVVQGFYGKDHDEIQQNLMEMFNIDWDVLRGNGRNFEQYANQYLEYADKVTAKRDAGEKYTAEDFVRDVNAGKFGLDAETRKKVFEAADIDVQRGEELYQNWLKDGNKALEQIGDDHIFLTKQEKEAAETVKQTNEILASTPEGAFQAVANFLDGVEKAITNKNAAKDFRTFMDDIKDIFSKDNMKIEGASDFGQIADFIKMVDTTSNNSNGLKDSFSTLMNGISQTINGLSIDETKLDPITNFLDKLDASSEVFTNGDSSGIQKFVDNLYSAMENSGGDASAAANTIAEVINVTLLEKQDKFVEIGQFIVIWIAAGMIAYQNVVREAANQTATTLTTAFNQQAVDKAPQSGKDFITEFTKGIVSEESVSALDTALNTLFSSLNEATAAAGETTEESSALGGGSAGTRFGQQFVHDMAQSITEGSITAFTGLTQSIANLPQSISEALDEDKQKELTAAVDGISSMLSGIVPDGSSMAMNMIEGIISTLTANGPLIADLMAWIAAGAQGEFNRENESHSPSRKYKKFAGYITDGIVIGLQNGSRDVNKASADVALGALNTAKDVLGIHSPGKEPEEQIGIPYDQGVAKGIENGEPAVQAAVTDMAENAVETGNSVISKNLGKSIDTGLFRNNLMNNLNNLSPYPAGTNKYLQDVQNDIKNIMGEIITTEENGLTVGQTLTERAIEHFMSATSGIKTMTEEEAAVIQGFWSQILNGDFGVLEGANSATGREAMLKDMKLTWEQFARFSNNTSTLDLSSITKGINDYSDAVGVLTKDSSMEDVINSIYSGLLGNGEKRKEAIEGLGKDYDFTQFILKKMWNLKPGEKIDYDFIDANYEALLNSFNDAVAAGKDLLGEEMDEAVPIVISPTVDDTALNAARDKIIEATTSQQEAQKVATTERGNAPKVGDNTESTGGSAPSVVYNQYNTSPKPIDALEVYRRTANQFAQMRGLLHADD